MASLSTFSSKTTTSRGRRRGWHRLAVLAAGLAAASLCAGLCGLVPGRAGAAGSPATSISLLHETPWVTSTAGMRLTVAIKSPIARSHLALQVTPYDPLIDRSTFEETTTGGLANLNPWPSPPVVLPLTTKGLLQPSGRATVVLRMAPPAVPGPAVKAPANGAVLDVPCSNQCAGVYPLKVSLIDTLSYTSLGAASSFVTYLILVPSAATNPLRFSMVLPVGANPAFASDGTPAVPATDVSELEKLDSALSSDSGTAMSVALYPQLADALETLEHVPASAKDAVERTAARNGLGALHSLVSLPNVQIESTTYSAADLSALAGIGLPGEVGDQLAAGSTALHALGARASGNPYVATTPTGPGALSLLTSHGVRQVIVPSDSVSPLPSTWEFPVWAPFKVKNSPAVVDASDPYLEQHLEGSDSVLGANQLLADLAMLYFVEPGLSRPRGVTLLAPLGWQPSSSFLSTVLPALASSPIVKPVTLSQFFNEVPPGSDEVPSGATASPLLYRQVVAGPTSFLDQVPSRPVAAARSTLASLSGLLPSQPDLVAGASRLVLIGETAGLSRSVRLAYLSAPQAELRRASAGLSLPAPRVITITSLSAKVPISVSSKGRMPVRVNLVLSNCRPSAIPAGCDSTALSFEQRVIPLTLDHGNRVVEVHVSTRSSGDFSLYLQLTAPNGAGLTSTVLTIRSTAISGVAIVLTAVAAAFLIGWWGRSVLKRRRGRHARAPRSSAAAAPSST